METIIREKPSVDVILPNYNKAEFLDEAINSVICQSYKNWKLLIILININVTNFFLKISIIYI